MRIWRPLATDEAGRAILHDVFRAEGLVVEQDIYADVRETLAPVGSPPPT